MSKIIFRNRTNGPQEILQTNGTRILVPAMGEAGPFDEADFPADTMSLIRACQVVEIVAHGADKKSAPAAPAALPGMTAPAAPAALPGMTAPAAPAALPGMTAPAPTKGKAGRPKKSDAAPAKRGRPKKSEG